MNTTITQKNDISILLGSRIFVEGWDSNRPNVVNFINIGVDEDARSDVVVASVECPQPKSIPEKIKRHGRLFPFIFVPLGSFLYSRQSLKASKTWCIVVIVQAQKRLRDFKRFFGGYETDKMDLFDGDITEKLKRKFQRREDAWLGENCS